MKRCCASTASFGVELKRLLRLLNANWNANLSNVFSSFLEITFFLRRHFSGISLCMVRIVQQIAIVSLMLHIMHSVDLCSHIEHLTANKQTNNKTYLHRFPPLYFPLPIFWPLTHRMRYFFRGLRPRVMAAAKRCSCQMDLCAHIRSGFHSTLPHSPILYMYTFPLRYGEVFCVWIACCTLKPTTQQSEWEIWKRADFSSQRTRFLRVISVFIFHVCRSVSSDDHFSSFSAFIHENGSRTIYENVWRCAKYSISKWQKMKEKKSETSNAVARSST